MKTFNYNKFIKKYSIALTGKLLDLVILYFIGAMLGLHIVKF